MTDADMDGVQDNNDRCANTSVGVQVDNAGCEIEVNLAPSVSLIATQSGVNITIVNTNAGNVSIQATVVDKNQADTHTYTWTVSGVSSFENNGSSLRFDPLGLTITKISIRLKVSDNAQPSLSDETSMNLSVELPPSQSESETQDSEPSGGSTHLFVLFGLALLHTIRLKWRIMQ